MKEQEGRRPTRGCLVAKSVDQRQPMQAKQRERSLAGNLPVRACRNPSPQFVGGEQPGVDQPRRKPVLQASK
jgi:hypothetical protein